jgi:hypothetical protein
VRPFWETLTQEERVQLLSISLDDLRVRAKDLTARMRKQAGVEIQTTCCPAMHRCSKP